MRRWGRCGRRARAAALVLRLVGALALALALAGCHESLPPRIQPEAPLRIVEVLTGQGTGMAGLHVAITVVVANAYEETLDAPVQITGSFLTRWPGHRQVTATVPVAEQRHLHLAPGDRYVLGRHWHLDTDDGRNLLAMLDFATGDIRHGVLYARPEQLELEVQLTLFQQTGLLQSGPHPFVLQGWRQVGGASRPRFAPARLRKLAFGQTQLMLAAALSRRAHGQPLLGQRSRSSRSVVPTPEEGAAVT